MSFLSSISLPIVLHFSVFDCCHPCCGRSSDISHFPFVFTGITLALGRTYLRHPDVSCISLKPNFVCKRRNLGCIVYHCIGTSFCFIDYNLHFLLFQMASKPLSTEAIALTEKKMDMSLDEIIQMSKKNNSNGKKPQRISNKSQGFAKSNAYQKNFKAQRFMDSRTFVRQDALAQKRTNFRSNQFALTTEIAGKAQTATNRNRGNNWRNQRAAASSSITIQPPENSNSIADKPVPQTLDALFASMKQERILAANQKSRLGAASNPPRWSSQNPRGKGSGYNGGAARRSQR